LARVAKIKFLKPGLGSVRAVFFLEDQQVDSAGGTIHLIKQTAHIIDNHDKSVAPLDKTL